MLTVKIPRTEFYDEERNEFVAVREQVLELEHSLISVAKWESKWEKPFLSSVDKTDEELTDYIRNMTITRNVDPKIYTALPTSVVSEISDYICAPMTATTFHTVGKERSKGETITAEIVYYWMIALNIPFECQKWHINRLLTLIKVCNLKNSGPGKMSRRDQMAQQRALNAARRKQYNTKG